MVAFARRCAPIALMTLAAGLLAFHVDSRGDWLEDSWPSVHALAGGHVSAYLSAPAMMGPFATMVEAPFVWIAGASRAQAFGWGALPGILAVAYLGLYLAEIAGRRGASRTGQTVLALLCLVNPLTIAALEGGHPEELLTGALAVAAIAAAGEDRPVLTAVLLGLALVSKQWAVLAIPPVLMALPGRRLRVLGGAVGLAALLALPGLIASPSAFLGVQESAASTGRVVTPFSIWYPLAQSGAVTYQVGGEQLAAVVHRAPAAAGALSHPLILLGAIAVPLALVWRRRRLGLSAADAMALFALLIVTRCAFDPVDNLYYHAPLLLALLGWDAFATEGLPFRGLFGSALALLAWQVWREPVDVPAFNAVYLLAALAAFVWLVSSLFKPRTWTFVARNRVFGQLNPNSWD